MILNRTFLLDTTRDFAIIAPADSTSNPDDTAALDWETIFCNCMDVNEVLFMFMFTFKGSFDNTDAVTDAVAAAVAL